MKKYVALLLSLVMVLSLCPVTVFATGYSAWSDGETLSDETYDLSGATITITGTLTVDGAVTVKNGEILRGSGFTGAMFTVGSGASLTLEGVTVDGNKENQTGDSLIVINEGTVTLGSGTVLTNNKIASDTSISGRGSAVTVTEGTLNINGGKITNNVANSDYSGSTIKTYYGSTVNMTAGMISENSGARHGGAIQLYGAKASDENEVKQTVFNMSGGTISNNKLGYSSGVGGGVAVSGEALFNMTGGIIAGNACGTSGRGGGVAFSESASNNIGMSISGDAVISRNKKDSADNNLEIGKDNKLTVGIMTSVADIGVTMSDTPGVFSTGGAIYTDNFKSDNALYGVAADGDNLKLTPLSVQVGGVEMYGSNTLPTYYKNGDTDPLTGTSTDYNAKLETVDGVLTLTLNGFDYSNNSTNGIYADGDLTIVLQGNNTITGSNITGSNGIYADGDLTITDDATNPGTLTATGDGSHGIYAASKITITGGKVTAEGDKYGIYAGSDLTISGGEVEATATGDDSHGIYAASKITITGGKVTAEGDKYGIYAGSDITISGGEVEAAATADGSSGLYADNDITIESNGVVTAMGDKYGIYADSNIDITGGTVNATAIEDDKNNIGIGISAGDGIYISGGSVTATGKDYGIYAKNDIYITGGTFDRDVTAYVPSGYVVTNQNGVYTVSKNIPYYPTVTPSIPSTDTPVASAKTFDAGIALAVAVSILSVTGSAVLLRKKED